LGISGPQIWRSGGPKSRVLGSIWRDLGVSRGYPSDLASGGSKVHFRVQIGIFRVGAPNLGPERPWQTWGRSGQAWVRPGQAGAAWGRPGVAWGRPGAGLGGSWGRTLGDPKRGVFGVQKGGLWGPKGGSFGAQKGGLLGVWSRSWGRPGQARGGLGQAWSRSGQGLQGSPKGPLLAGSQGRTHASASLWPKPPFVTSG